MTFSKAICAKTHLSDASASSLAEHTETGAQVEERVEALNMPNRNIQVIDAADNCTFDIYGLSGDDFALIFPNERDIEFVEDFFERVGDAIARATIDRIWACRLSKKTAHGIHGTLFYGLLEKRPFYPSKKESEMALGL